MSESNYEKCHVSYRGRIEREIDIAHEILQKHKKPCAAAVEELRDNTDLSLHESCSMLRCLWRDDKLEQLQAENARLKRDLEDQGAYDQYLRDRLNQENDLRKAAEAEKNELRDELAKARDPQRIGGQADPSSFVYAIEQLREFRWQHATNDDDAIPYINNVAEAHEREVAELRDELAKWESLTANIELPEQPITEFRPKDLERENAKLRELVSNMWVDVSNKTYCPHYWEYVKRMQELGFEVPA